MTTKKNGAAPLAKTDSASSIAPIDITTALPQFSKDADMMTAEEFDALLATAKTAEEATALLFNSSGLLPYTDKQQLAASGAPFNVVRIGYRPNGGFSKDDDFALLIEDKQTGRRSILTFEQNLGRNDFMVKMHALIQKFGYAPNIALEYIERKEKEPFYLLVPAPTWGMSTATANGEIIEGEVVGSAR